jgi:hypothetical protein
VTTHQSQLEAERKAEREDMKVDAMLAAPKNSARIHMMLGEAVIVASGVSTCTAFMLDRAALRLLAADIAEAERCLKSQPIDDEEKSPDTLPSTPVSKSSAPPPEVTHQCETCQYEHNSADQEPCEECCNDHDNWEPKWDERDDEIRGTT